MGFNSRSLHNHIYWNAVSLDGKKKFRDFRRSHRANKPGYYRLIVDIITESDVKSYEHKFEVIE